MSSSRHESNGSSSPPLVPTSFCPCQSLESSNPASSDGSPLKVYCPTCVRRILTPQIEKHAIALEERNRSRSWCSCQLHELRSDDNNDDNNNDNGRNEDDDNSNGKGLGNDMYGASPPARHKIAQYRDSFAQLQKRLESLRRECVTVSVSLASRSLSNDERGMNLGVQKNRIIVARQELERLSDSVLFSPVPASSATDLGGGGGGEEEDGSGDHRNNSADRIDAGGSTLNDSLHIRILEVKKKRFHLALQAFEMHRMDVGTEYDNVTLSDFLRLSHDKEHQQQAATATATATTHKYNNNNNNEKMFEPSQFERRIRDKVVSGIGKIGGLPLPHRGALYNCLTSDVLASSLRLVAGLTQLLARCLGILLPRPILMRPITDHGCNTAPDRSNGTSQHDSTPTRFVSRECRFKHRTEDIIANVKPEKEACPNGGSGSRPNEITTMQDLEELGENDCGSEDNSSRGISNPVSVPSDSLENAASSDTMSQSYQQRAKSTIASTSTNSLLSLVGSSSNLLSRAFDKMKGHQHQHQHTLHQSNTARRTIGDGTGIDGTTNNASMASMDDLSVSARLRHASCAVICDNITSSVSSAPAPKEQRRIDTGSNGAAHNAAAMHYELRPPQYSSGTSPAAGGVLDRDALNQQEENFIMGLHLLQNNVVALSLQAGVPVSALWPAEAVLLNLHSLKLFCMEQKLI